MQILVVFLILSADMVSAKRWAGSMSIGKTGQMSKTQDENGVDLDQLSSGFKALVKQNEALTEENKALTQQVKMLRKGLSVLVELAGEGKAEGAGEGEDAQEVSEEAELAGEDEGEDAQEEAEESKLCPEGGCCCQYEADSAEGKKFKVPAGTFITCYSAIACDSYTYTVKLAGGSETRVQHYVESPTCTGIRVPHKTTGC